MIFGCRTRRVDDISLSSYKYLLSAFGKKCHLNAQDCSSNEKSFGDKEVPHAVFNALDNILKDSLERLKMMRLALMSSNLKYMI